MPIALYRRHRQSCKAGHQHNSRTSEYDERKKNWKRCACPIFASGSLNGIFKRQNTGHWEWENAKRAAANFETCGSWDGPKAEPPAPAAAVPGAADAKRTTIEDATRAFLAQPPELRKLVDAIVALKCRVLKRHRRITLAAPPTKVAERSRALPRKPARSNP